MDAITRYTGDALSRAESWTSLDPAERKRRAITALRDKNISDLWSLTEAHLTLYGKSGTKLSSHTAAAYRTSIAQLLVYWSGVSLTRPTRDQAALLVRAMERDGKSSSTITVRLAGARALYRALRWAGAVDIDPLADVRPARDLTPAWERRQPYLDSEVVALLEAATTRSDRFLILLGSDAGLRISEILALQWAEVWLSRGEIEVLRGKGGKRRTVPISGRLTMTLRAVLEWERCGYLIPYRSDEQARNHLRALCQKAGIDYKSPHSLRHACGTRVVRSGGDLQDVANMLGHSSLETARVYAKWADDSLRARVADW